MLGCFATPLLLRFTPALVVTRSTNFCVAIAATCFGMADFLDAPAAVVSVMCITRFVYGLGMSMNEISSQSMVFRMVTEDQIPMANGVLFAVRMIGMLGSPILGAALYSAGGSQAPMLVRPPGPSSNPSQSSG